MKAAVLQGRRPGPRYRGLRVARRWRRRRAAGGDGVRRLSHGPEGAGRLDTDGAAGGAGARGLRRGRGHGQEPAGPLQGRRQRDCRHALSLRPLRILYDRAVEPLPADAARLAVPQVRRRDGDALERRRLHADAVGPGLHGLPPAGRRRAGGVVHRRLPGDDCLQRGEERRATRPRRVRDGHRLRRRGTEHHPDAAAVRRVPHRRGGHDRQQVGGGALLRRVPHREREL